MKDKEIDKLEGAALDYSFAQSVGLMSRMNKQEDYQYYINQFGYDVPVLLDMNYILTFLQFPTVVGFRYNNIVGCGVITFNNGDIAASDYSFLGFVKKCFIKYKVKGSKCE